MAQDLFLDGYLQPYCQIYEAQETLISWEDMVCITDITAGPHTPRSYVYSMHERAT